MYSYCLVLKYLYLLLLIDSINICSSLYKSSHPFYVLLYLKRGMISQEIYHLIFHLYSYYDQTHSYLLFIFFKTKLVASCLYVIFCH